MAGSPALAKNSRPSAVCCAASTGRELASSRTQLGARTGRRGGEDLARRRGGDRGEGECEMGWGAVVGPGLGCGEEERKKERSKREGITYGFIVNYI